MRRRVYHHDGHDGIARADNLGISRVYRLGQRKAAQQRSDAQDRPDTPGDSFALHL